MYYYEMQVSRQARPRHSQRARTRRDLAEAARQLVASGAVPTVATAAEAAGVSRATAYRYFPTQVDLLRFVMDTDVEALLDTIEQAETVEDRVSALVEADHEMRRTNEAQQRAWVRISVEQRGRAEHSPIPRGGRIRAIDAALEPIAERMPSHDLHRLKVGLSLLIGAESFLVLKDLWGLEGEEAKQVIRWATEALVHQSGLGV